MTQFTHEPQSSLATLLEMLETRRPAGSKSERAFIARHIRPLGVDQDEAGNLIKRIGDAPVLWSSHTDTVHKQGGRQRISLLNDTVHVTDSNCLGADNAAGIWLMREMILSKIPGLYIFHRQEESGGIGSSHIANHDPGLVDGMKAAIAFDRRGTRSIITHQWAGRTCSDAFGESLAQSLGMGMTLDDGGSFTDTASYIDLIGECTNVSAGFQNEHSKSETLNLTHLLTLRESLLRADFSTLVFEREPGEIDPVELSWSRHYRESDLKGWDNLDFEDSRATSRSLARVVRDYPDEVADWLEAHGVDAAELLDAALDRRFG
jgi:hypothetical protein